MVTRVRSPVGDEDDPPRVAYQVGRAVGGAVVRNRLRRRLRAAVRDHALRFGRGSAYLVAAGHDAVGRTSAELSEVVGRLVDELEGDGRA